MARAAEPPLVNLDLVVMGAEARPGDLAGILRHLARENLITKGLPGPPEVMDLDQAPP